MRSTPPVCFDDPGPTFWRVSSRLPLLLYRLLRWRPLRGGWLWDHLFGRTKPDLRQLAATGPIDIMVLVSDHYEPARQAGDQAAVASVRSWCERYEQLASRHQDSDGRPPQHTWFYRYDYPNPGCLEELSACAYRGFGEVEFHLHHGHDTEASFRATLQAGLEWFNRQGALLTAEAKPRRYFGYVAGNSALDNGAGDDSLSGCATEIRLLSEAGCYGDFTFPNLGCVAQPSWTNRIVYASEDGKPRSYDNWVEMQKGKKPSGDLMIFQGPVTIDWRRARIDDGTVEDCAPAHPGRLPAWLSGQVHVPGRPEWIFVKLHTHAMQSRASFLGKGMDATLEAMSQRWNSGPFRLHHVTAREAYNIAKAAEAGRSGNPNDYRDFLLARPANRVACCNIPWLLQTYTPDRVRIEFLEPRSGELHMRSLGLRWQGRLRGLEATFQEGRADTIMVDGDAQIDLGPEAAGARLIGEKAEVLA